MDREQELATIDAALSAALRIAESRNWGALIDALKIAKAEVDKLATQPQEPPQSGDRH